MNQQELNEALSLRELYLKFVTERGTVDLTGANLTVAKFTEDERIEAYRKWADLDKAIDYKEG